MSEPFCKCKKSKGVMVGTTRRCTSCGLPMPDGKSGEHSAVERSYSGGHSSYGSAETSQATLSRHTSTAPPHATVHAAVILDDEPPAGTSTALPSAPPSRWTVPVRMEQWPIFRSMVQFLAGLVLTLMFGLAWLIIPFLAFTIAVGVAFGLGLASAMNGLLVMRYGRRYTFRGVLAILLAVQVFGLVFQPGLANLICAAFFRAQGDVAKLHELLHRTEQWPADFRNRPARLIAIAALRKHYDAAYEKAAKRGSGDARLGVPFQQLLADVASHGSPEVVVDLQEDVDDSVPPEAKKELLMAMLVKAQAKGQIGEEDMKNPPKPVEELDKTFAGAGQNERGKEFAKALAAEIGKVLPDADLKVLPASEAGAGPHPRLEFRGHVKHSGHFQSMSHSYSVLGNMRDTGSFELAIIPTIEWKLRLLDADGNVLGEDNVAVAVPDDATWSESDDYGNVTPAAIVPRQMAYELTAWELAHRAGLESGQPPRAFPLAAVKPKYD